MRERCAWIDQANKCIRTPDASSSYVECCLIALRSIRDRPDVGPVVDALERHLEGAKRRASKITRLR